MFVFLEKTQTLLEVIAGNVCAAAAAWKIFLAQTLHVLQNVLSNDIIDMIKYFSCSIFIVFTTGVILLVHKCME